MIMQASLSQVMNVLFFFFISHVTAHMSGKLDFDHLKVITSIAEYEKSLHTMQNLGAKKDGSCKHCCNFINNFFYRKRNITREGIKQSKRIRYPQTKKT